MQSLPGRLPLGNFYRGVIRPGASSRRNPFRNLAPSLSQSAEPRQQRRVSAYFFISSDFCSFSKSSSNFISKNPNIPVNIVAYDRVEDKGRYQIWPVWGI